MKCDEVRETMPDLAAGLVEPSGEVQQHLQTCAPCTAQLQELQKTMALLDEWEAPEPSAYFDTRLQARLREEKAAEISGGRRGWLTWLPRPALAMAAALIIALGIGVFRMHNTADSGGSNVAVAAPAAVGTAVGDLQTLDSDNELYANFDELDDIDSHQNQATATN